MKVLVTGLCGNAGRSVARELLAQGHAVRGMAHKTQPEKEFAGRLEVTWGDIRQPADVAAAVAGQEVIIHLAAIIPPLSELDPARSESINVGGTRHVLAAIRSQPNPAKLIYASSLAVFGRDQDPPLVRTIADPVRPSDHYTEHKLHCERLVRESGLEWAILRLGHIVPYPLNGKDLRMVFREMFGVPLSQPTEIIHAADVGLALANAVTSQDIWGKTLLIGGGPSCQIYFREFYQATLETMGVGMFPERAFGSAPFHTHWLDTMESQRLLHFQRWSFQDYVREMATASRYQRWLARLFRPVIRRWILQQSPYYRPRDNALRPRPET